MRRRNLIALENRLMLRALPGAAVLHCYDLSVIPLLLQGGLNCACSAEQGAPHFVPENSLRGALCARGYELMCMCVLSVRATIPIVCRRNHNKVKFPY